jgi:PAS domain S-box-containing protein
LVLETVTIAALALLIVAVAAVLLIRAQRAKRSAEQAEERLRAVIEATPLALTLVDADARVRLWNPGAEQIFGWTADEVIGKLLPTVPPGLWEGFREEIARQIAGEALGGVELPAVHKDGRSLDVRVWSAPFRDERGRIVASLGIIADISEAKRLETELRQAQKLESVSKLAGGIAHDFNNLLTVIGAQYELALKQLALGHPVRASLEDVRRAADSASALTRQLLAFSRKQLLQPTVLDLNDVVAFVVGMLRAVLGEDVELVTRLEPGVPAVRADRSQLEQVLMNLAVNAREAMLRGGRLTIETRGSEPGERPPYAELTVADTGDGMTPEVQTHAFEPFYTTKQDGSGLGLATVYGVIQQSGGSITVDSAPGAGTRFTIRLPGVTHEVAAPPPPAALAPAEPAADGNEPVAGRVLVVEDDDLLRRLVAELLEGAGFDVLTADDGVTALALFEQDEGRFDVLLTDLVMPRMSGRELADRVQEIDRRCRVVYTSGYDAEFDFTAAPPSYDTAVLPKPFSADELIAVVRSAATAGRARADDPVR